MHNQNINLEKPLPLGDWYHYFIDNFTKVLTAIGDANTEYVIYSLHDILWTSGAALMGAWGQILLWDENEDISLVLINTGGEKILKESIRKDLDKLELSLLGTHLEDEWFIKKIPQKYKDSVLYLNRIDSISKLEKIGYTSPYRIYQLNLKTTSPDDILANSILAEEFIPTFIHPNTSNLLWNWLNNLIVVGAEWPGTEDIPKLSGIVAFALDPVINNKEKMKEFLFDNRELLTTMAWIILFPVFVFQTYALSQASIKEQSRLRKEIQFSGWSKLLIEMSQNNKMGNNESKIEEVLIALIKNNSYILCKQIIREVLKKSGEGFEQVYISLLSNWLCGNDNEEKKLALLFSDLLLHKTTFEYLGKDIINACFTLSSGENDNEFPSTFDIKITTFENIFFQVKSNSIKNQILDYLDSMPFDHSDNIQIDRMLLTALLFTEDSNNKINNKAVNLFYKLITKHNNNNGYPCELLESVFMTISVEAQNRVIRSLDMCDNLPIKQQLLLIKNEVERYNKPKGNKIQSRWINKEFEVISVLSSKGGVGKSIISLGLGLGLSTNDKNKVCVIDLDLSGPTFYKMFSNQDSFLEKKIYINDYLWALYLKENPYTKDDTKKSIFYLRDYWWDRFERLSFEEKDDLREKLLVEINNWGNNIQIILASPNNSLKKLSHPFLEKRHTVTSSIIGLLRWLKKRNYTHVVIDTPAEFKELSESAIELTNLYKGKNVFVSTSFGPSLQQAIRKTTTKDTSSTRNYLVINKLRKLDERFAVNKSALIEYLSSVMMFENFGNYVYLSNTLGNKVININNISTIHWNEDLENFQNPPKSIDSKDELLKLLSAVNSGIIPIIQKEGESLGQFLY